MDKKTRKIISTSFSNGRKHDFRLFKESKTYIHSRIKVITDSGYQGIKKIHSNSELPKKRSKKTPLTKEEIKNNKKVSVEWLWGEEGLLPLVKNSAIV